MAGNLARESIPATAETGDDVRGGAETTDCVDVSGVPGDMLWCAAVSVFGWGGYLCDCCSVVVGCFGAVDSWTDFDCC